MHLTPTAPPPTSRSACSGRGRRWTAPCRSCTCSVWCGSTTRAVRPDKVTLAAVAATLGLYRAGRATMDIPVWRMIAETRESLGARADALVAELPAHAGEVVSVSLMLSAVGGGSLPGQLLGSVGLIVRGPSPTALAARLRAGDPPVIGRVESGALWLDLRTVDPRDDAALVSALVRSLTVARSPTAG